MIPEPKLDALVARHQAVERELASPVAPETYVKLSREFAELAPIVETVNNYRAVAAEIAGLDALIADAATDAEMRAMAATEKPQLEQKRAALERELRLALIPKDAMDERNVILEIRAGTGGDEAALFAGDLFRMYERYAATQGWKVEVISLSEGTMGGFKEIVAEIRGRGPHPYLDRHRRRAARGSRRRYRHRRRRPQDRHLALGRRRRPARQQDRIGGARDPHSHRHRRHDAGRPLATPQSRQGDGGATRQALRFRASEAGRRARRRAARPSRLRRPLRAHPHL